MAAAKPLTLGLPQHTFMLRWAQFMVVNGRPPTHQRVVAIRNRYREQFGVSISERHVRQFLREYRNPAPVAELELAQVS